MSVYNGRMPQTSNRPLPAGRESMLASMKSVDDHSATFTALVIERWPAQLCRIPKKGGNQSMGLRRQEHHDPAAGACHRHV